MSLAPSVTAPASGLAVGVTTFLGTFLLALVVAVFIWGR
jgi:hypothetical protein